MKSFKIGDQVQYVGHTKRCRNPHPKPDGTPNFWDVFLGAKGVVFDPNKAHATVGVRLAGEPRYGYRSHFELIKKAKGSA